MAQTLAEPKTRGEPKTLAEKVWERHVVHRAAGEPDLLYVDLHLVHEVTSPQAFEALRLAGRPVRRPDLTVATMDHNVPTTDGPVTDRTSARQMEALATNAKEFDITLYPWGSAGQGIVHVIGPEMGYTQPGLTIVCGDSHTSTHGAFGALAFGIGTSEVEHVLATQTIPQTPARTMAITVDGDLPAGCGAKDVILGIINRIGTGGGVGHVIEYRGLRDPRAVDGRSHDDLQHVDRGRRPRGDGRSRRHDVRLPGGQAARAVGRRLGAGPRRLALPPHRRRRDVRRGGHDRRHRPPPARLVGDEPGPVGHDRRRRSRARLLRRRGEARRRPPRSGVHGARAGDDGSATSGRTPSSSAPARTHGSRISAWPPGSSRDAAWPRDSVRWSCPARSP